MSRRTRELLLLLVAGAVATIAYVSVYAGRFHEISRWSIIYAGIFVAIFGLLHVVVRRRLPQADPYLLPLAALLSSLGLAEIYRIDPALALLQGRWLVVGAVVFVLTLLVVRDHARLDRYRYLIGAVGLLLLLVTIVAGTEVNGAKLWIRFAGFSFQPSEFAKIAIVIFLAGYLNDNKEMLSVPTTHVLGVPIPPLKYFGPLVVMWVLSLALLVFMKDFGMSLLLLAAFVALIYMATSRLAYVVLGGALFAAGAALAVQLVPHVHERVTVWIDPWSHASTSGYQVLQSLFTIADGGVTGVGPRPRLPAVLKRTAGGARHADRLHLRGPCQRAGSAGRRRPGALLPALLLARLPHRRVGHRRLLQAAGRRSGGHLRGADVPHHRRRHPPHPAHRHHAAVRELRRQLAAGQPHAAGPAAHGQPPHQRGARRLARPSACDWRGWDEADEQGHRAGVHRLRRCSSWRSSATSPTCRWWHAGSLRDKPQNHLAVAQELRVKRGLIKAFDGSVIAGVRQQAGDYYRTYPQGSFAAAAHRLRQRRASGAAASSRA